MLRRRGRRLTPAENSAAEHAGRASKKTIQPPDVIDAVRDLELPNFTARLEAELASATLPSPSPRTTPG
jgi:hypothetical protein